MGCGTSSMYIIGKRKKKIIPEVSMFVPLLRVPAHMDMQRTFIPKNLANRITSLRNQISFVAEDTGGSAISELIKALEEYLSLVIGLTKKEILGLQDLVEFGWKDLEGGKQDICVTNPWLELLLVLYMMSILTLMEANLKLILKDSSLSPDTDCMRDAVDLLVKAAGYLNFCVHDVIPRLPPDMKDKLPSDVEGSVLESILYQALALGTQVQLGLALQSQNATLSVKRRLACEQLSFFTKAYFCLSHNAATARKKQLSFLKWKHLEAKAGAYYYHGLILDKAGTEPSSHVSAACCFLAAEDLLAESKKTCLTFCLAHPLTRATPPWGATKHFHKKIPEKAQMYSYLLDQEKGPQSLPHLPEFELSLKPDDYDLPELDPAWEIPGQTTLKAHLNDNDEDDDDDERQT